MWAEKEKYKNHFLQIQLKHLEPKQINGLVHNEFIINQGKRESCNVLQNNTKKICTSALYFENRAQLAYGFWALPKLMKELGSDDYLIQWRAINSLSEYVVNPLHAQRAIQDFDIVRRCQNVFLRIRMKYYKVKYKEAARLLIIFFYLAQHRSGAKKIVEKNRLLDQFYAMLIERKEHYVEVANILPLLSRDLENVMQLIDGYKVLDKLLNIFQLDVCVRQYPADLWLHLVHVLEQVPQEAVAAGFFEILYTRIQGRLHEYHVWDMKCFALLLRCPDGQQRFVQVDGVKMLRGIIKEEELDSYEQVVYALMNGLFAKTVLWRCREFTDLPLLITNLAKATENVNQQLYCLQTLRELGVMPVIKRFIKANCLEDIKTIECKTKINHDVHQELIYWLEREIYHNTNLRKENILDEETYSQDL